MRIISVITLLMSVLFSQNKDITKLNTTEGLSVIFGINQSFYDNDWNDLMKDFNQNGNLKKEVSPSLNFGIMKELPQGEILGLKYITNGFNIEHSYQDTIYQDTTISEIDTSIITNTINYKNNSNLNLSNLKFFLISPTPIIKNLYFGFESGLFLNANRKNTVSFEDTLLAISYEDTSLTTLEKDYNRNDWQDDGFISWEIGVICQYYYNINKNIALLFEGYYGLTDYPKKGEEPKETGIPNSMHYMNFGINYRFGS
ncbi:MAG: hypothetical protein CMG55_06260 [Candidatus Marinimicrobia bacterium]|nr:hypothetical protein [Candidatus Neomarinimicrobiota bacterium]|tara:strand:+ start:2737 stop:3507 length:771 start_codon:yes stop_codon:yes gene_type:complete